MQPRLKRAIAWSGGLILLAAGSGLGLVYGMSGSRLQRRYELAPEELAIPDSDEARALGQHLATAVMGCTDCHAPDLGGKVMIEDPAMGRVVPRNLTRGRGGIGDYAPADWVRAIRHGVGPDGRPLFFMPSQDYYPFSDAELGALIAWLRSVPAVDRELPPSSPGPLARALLLKGDLVLAAERIDHAAPRPAVPPRGPTREYGAVLVNVCTGCHGADLGGGPIPGVPPDWPPARNISPDPQAGIGAWTEADFIEAMREGVRPDGAAIDERMPWRAFAAMSDDELHALWLYLRSVPPVPRGS